MSAPATAFALAALAAAFGGGAGCALARAWCQRRDAAERKRRLLAGTPGADGAAGGGQGGFASKGAAAAVLRYAASLSRRLSLRATRPLAPPRRSGRQQSWLSAHAAKAGLKDAVTEAACREVRMRLGAAGALAGAFIGSLFSLELACGLAVLGGAAGAAALRWAVREEECRRADELERDLAEMLDVVALGLRSGLPFDRSLGLYAEHFATPLSRAFAAAQRRWAMGLATREEALRELAASYDSALFGRVIEGIVRSLRFGSALAEGLEAAAAEARAANRAHVEEKVAKAPVKMMIPTGTLILPAMLLLVLGPVLLELVQGF